MQNTSKPLFSVNPISKCSNVKAKVHKMKIALKLHQMQGNPQIAKYCVL